MKKRWDEALRSLARRSQGPFRALAYGVTGTSAAQSELSADLESLLRSAALEPVGDVVAEVADPFTSAVHRPRFKDRVLPWIASGDRSHAPEVAPPLASDQARRDLETIAADLAGYLDRLEERPRGAGFRLLPEPPRSAPKPPLEETPIVIVRQFEDLGGDAEGIAAAVEAILIRGAHLHLVSEGLDTRTREGRASAALAIRLGGIKAARARERSLEELSRRREGLQVYGPVPFGFLRRGQGLVPVAEQIETVARARELARRGASLLETALALNRERRVWKDGTPWTWRRVRQVLQNSIYDRAVQGLLA